jgi:hypothetical protein
MSRHPQSLLIRNHRGWQMLYAACDALAIETILSPAPSALAPDARAHLTKLSTLQTLRGISSLSSNSRVAESLVAADAPCGDARHQQAARDGAGSWPEFVQGNDGSWSELVQGLVGGLGRGMRALVDRALVRS